MKRKLMLSAVAGMSLLGLGVTAVIAQTPSKASFFLTSKGSGKGADLGGLEGADKHCAELAKSAGLVRKQWKAYLSTTPTKKGDTDVAGENARDRIGKGPWYNAQGKLIARNVTDLHSDNNKLDANTALTEKGEKVTGRAEALAKTGPNRHDILTGSDPQGRYIVAGDTTCGNWTKSSGEAPANSAIVGHHDRRGLNEFRHMKSWNTSHGSRGCSQDNLKASGGDGLFYCFATD